MTKPISNIEALARLQYICSKSEKCCQDIRDKLRQWGYEGDYEEIVSKLVQEQFVDDARFAEAFARDKFKFSTWGRNKIRYYLKGKHVAGGHIDSALASISEEDYTSTIYRELEKKAKTIKDKDTSKRKQKLFAFAAQRGYETDIVYNLVDSILKEEF